MLRSLHIKNYALIEEITIEFERGLNIITGETGAGKSIVLGAFGLLMGDRASSDVVRAGAEKAVVEAEFLVEGNARLSEFLSSQDLQLEQDVLIVRREVLARGTSRGFVNDSPATSQLLKELAGYLVDLHGQHEHQSLLRAEGHVVLLDEYGGLGEALTRYRSLRQSFLELHQEISQLEARARRADEERDFAQFQLGELDSVSPKENEDVELEDELKVLENAEGLRNAAAEIRQLIYEDEGSAYERLSKAKQLLEQFGAIDPSLMALVKELAGALASVDELAKFFATYSDRVELEPQRLEDLRQRSIAISRLKRKYGGDLARVLERQRDLSERLKIDEELGEIIAGKRKDMRKVQIATTSAAISLSESRRATANQLGPAVAIALTELGIEHSRFEVQFGTREFVSDVGGESSVAINGRQVHANSRGIDVVEFFLSTNLGEVPKPLAKVASGGEVSRIMLALKAILAKHDKLPLMVFDEIDVGVSGRIAQRVGRAMKLLSRDHQIIAISHLPQIAAFADAHFLVEKRVMARATSSTLRRLSESEHVEAVARLISGVDVTEASLGASRALIQEADRPTEDKPVEDKPESSTSETSRRKASRV